MQHRFNNCYYWEALVVIEGSNKLSNRDNGGLIKALKLFVKEGCEVDIDVNVQLCKVVIYKYVFCWL